MLGVGGTGGRMGEGEPPLFNRRTFILQMTGGCYEQKVDINQGRNTVLVCFRESKGGKMEKGVGNRRGFLVTVMMVMMMVMM